WFPFHTISFDCLNMAPASHRAVYWISDSDNAQPACSCLTCRRRKTRCFGERPVCSTCTKNSYTCQGYSDDAEKKKQEEDMDGSSKAALTGFQPHGNDSADENKRRHSKSNLSAAQSTPAPIGWPPQNR